MTSLRNYSAVLATVLATFVLIFLFSSNIRFSNANSGATNVVANVVVPSFCSLGISNTAINFGIVSGGTNVNTANLVVVNSFNSNIAGNVFIAGTTLTGPSSTIFINNVLWNPTAPGSYTGNALAVYTNSIVGPVDTKFTLAGGTGSSQNFFFGISVPTGQAPGTYVGNAVFQNDCPTLPGNSIQVTNTVFTINVPSACFITLSNSLIGFGSINPGSNVNTANLVVDTNTGGNVNANILVAGGNWISSGAPTFYVANTLWAATSQGSYSGTTVPLQAIAGFLDTKIEIVYPPTSSSNNIFFGVAVPAGQASGTYTQNIILENSC